MGAISKAYVSIADAAVDPASPLDTVLMTGLRDDVVHLREWLGFSYTAGAVQDHNHDGVNSAPIAGAVGHTEWWPGVVLPSGNGGTFDWCDGGTLSRVANAALKAALMKEATVTMTIASPAVVTWSAHGLRTNMPIRFFTTGALPTGITAGTHGGPGAGTEYFVKVIDANTFNVAATPGGANINTSGSQSGVHTGTVAPHGDGDGATTFHKPDMKGRVPIGRDDMGGAAANRITSANSGILGNVPGRSGGDERLHQHAHGVTDPTHAHTERYQGSDGYTGHTYITKLDSSVGPAPLNSETTTAAAATGISIQNAGAGASQNVQPAIVGDWIIRIS